MFAIARTFVVLWAFTPLPTLGPEVEDVRSRVEGFVTLEGVEDWDFPEEGAGPEGVAGGFRCRAGIARGLKQ